MGNVPEVVIKRGAPVLRGSSFRSPLESKKRYGHDWELEMAGAREVPKEDAVIVINTLANAGHVTDRTSQELRPDTIIGVKRAGDEHLDALNDLFKMRAFRRATIGNGSQFVLNQAK